MSYEMTGTVKLVMDLETFPSGFQKREFVVTAGDGRYPQDIKFEVVKDKVELLNTFRAGHQVKVSFDVRGNEHNGRYYVSLNAWKIDVVGGVGEPVQESFSGPSDFGGAPVDSSYEEDQLPF